MQRMGSLCSGISAPCSGTSHVLQCWLQSGYAKVQLCCRMDPLWNNVVVAGLQDEKPFLGMISMLGVHFSDEHIATGDHQTHA